MKKIYAIILFSFIAILAHAQCQAGFTSTINGATLSLTDVSTYSVSVNYYWQFGDGTYDWTNAPAPHTYQYSGTYIVCLSISDSLPQTCSSSFCDTIVITGAPNPPCNPVFTAYVD